MITVNQGIGLLFQKNWRREVGHMKFLLGGVQNFIGDDTMEDPLKVEEKIFYIISIAT